MPLPSTIEGETSVMSISKLVVTLANGAKAFIVSVDGGEAGRLSLNADTDYDADILVAGLSSLIWPEGGAWSGRVAHTPPYKEQK